MEEQSFGLKFNIGEAKRDSIASAAYRGPVPQEDDGLALLIAVSSAECSVGPQWCRLVLPKTGDSETVEFEVVAHRSGRHDFQVKLYLEKQLLPIQSLSFELNVGSAVAMGMRTIA